MQIKMHAGVCISYHEGNNRWFADDESLLCPENGFESFFAVRDFIDRRHKEMAKEKFDPQEAYKIPRFGGMPELGRVTSVNVTDGWCRFSYAEKKQYGQSEKCRMAEVFLISDNKAACDLIAAATAEYQQLGRALSEKEKQIKGYLSDVKKLSYLIKA